MLPSLLSSKKKQPQPQQGRPNVSARLCLPRFDLSPSVCQLMPDADHPMVYMLAVALDYQLSTVAARCARDPSLAEEITVMMGGAPTDEWTATVMRAAAELAVLHAVDDPVSSLDTCDDRWLRALHCRMDLVYWRMDVGADVHGAPIVRVRGRLADCAALSTALLEDGTASLPRCPHPDQDSRDPSTWPVLESRTLPDEKELDDLCYTACPTEAADRDVYRAILNSVHALLPWIDTYDMPPWHLVRPVFEQCLAAVARPLTVWDWFAAWMETSLDDVPGASVARQLLLAAGLMLGVQWPADLEADAFVWPNTMHQLGVLPVRFYWHPHGRIQLLYPRFPPPLSHLPVTTLCPHSYLCHSPPSK